MTFDNSRIVKCQDLTPPTALHLHAATGREGRDSVGCTRAGVDVWLVGKVVILEIQGTGGRRLKDPGTGFELLRFPWPTWSNRDVP